MWRVSSLPQRAVVAQPATGVDRPPDRSGVSRERSRSRGSSASSARRSAASCRTLVASAICRAHEQEEAARGQDENDVCNQTVRDETRRHHHADAGDAGGNEALPLRIGTQERPHTPQLARLARGSFRHAGPGRRDVSRASGLAGPLRKARARALRDPSVRRARAARARPAGRAADGAVARHRRASRACDRRAGCPVLRRSRRASRR